ncbi:hypothetical protein FKW77_005148 [Venturia effusa]|uniref:Heterokaryon incompatibility domain-containing protein n=1 Tax=Venturia effusa TaxID=50376 RepID=A0A517L990_9PEZI|nr:hypothetical protein FKW77_005148 [Venturia effusa]
MEPASFYRPLEQDLSIRVLLLEAGKPKEQIRCSLLYTTLDASPEFEAISYAWGDATLREDIVLDGRVFSITKSLHEALWQFRNSDGVARLLWADAICINQDDMKERSQQIQIMSKIYSSARHTLIWLGPVRPNTEQPEPLRINSDELAFRVLNLNDVVDTEWIQRDHIDPAIPAFEDNDVRKALKNLESREWFQRMWVIQELAVSKSPFLCCGPLRAPWSSLDHCYAVFGYVGLPGRALDVMRDRYQGDEFTFSDVIPVCFTFHATDPKDKVLGVVSMVTGGLGRLSVDSTMTVESMYISAVWSCFSDCRAGDGDAFLTLARVSERKNTKFSRSLPSWTPDLSVVSSTASPEFSWHSSAYDAAGYSYQFPEQQFDGKTLILRCAIIDSVKILIILENGQDVSNIQCVKATQRYPSGESMSNVLWRLRICDSSPEPNTYIFDHPQNTFGKYYLDDSVATQSKSTEPHSAELEEYQRLYESSIFPRDVRILCQTENNYLGWVHEPTRVGDKLCIFEGSGTPFVLRERPDGFYEVIGDAYIHGIMYGEAMRVSEFEWKEIGLR